MNTDAAAITDNPYIAFQAGVTATLRSWSALRTAVEQSWGGPSSHSKAEELRSNIFAYFDGSKKLKMEVDELEDNLLFYMEEEFGVVLEDGSEREVARLICSMYEACGRGDVTLAQSVMQTAIKAEETMKALNVKSVIQSGQEELEDDDNDDDDDDDDEDEGDDIIEDDIMEDDCHGVTNEGGRQHREEEAMEAMDDGTATHISITQIFASSALFGGGPPTKPKKELPPPRQLGEPEPEKPQPVVDDDGFAMVPTKKKAGAKR